MTKSWARRAVESTLAKSSNWKKQEMWIKDEINKQMVKEWYKDEGIKYDPSENWYMLNFNHEALFTELKTIIEEATGKAFEKNGFWVGDFTVVIKGSAIDAAREILSSDNKQLSV